MKTQEQKNIKTREQKGIIGFMFSCFNALMDKVADMDRRGVSEEVHRGELRGKTKDGKGIKVKYGYGIKVGLDDFVKKIKAKS